MKKQDEFGPETTLMERLEHAVSYGREFGEDYEADLYQAAIDKIKELDAAIKEESAA